MVASTIRNKWAVVDARRKLKARAIEYKGGKCERCGYNRCHEALEFHHRDPAAKSFSISTGIYRRWDTLRRELDKCMMICANCHREEHHRERAEWMNEQAKIARESITRRPAARLPCHRCGRVTNVRKARAERAQRIFCSVRCSGTVARKFVWPRPERLRKLVWSAPATDVAARYGVTSTAIKRMCKKLGIDTPPRGYWTKNEKRKLRMLVTPNGGPAPCKGV